MKLQTSKVKHQRNFKSQLQAPGELRAHLPARRDSSSLPRFKLFGNRYPGIRARRKIRSPICRRRPSWDQVNRAASRTDGVSRSPRRAVDCARLAAAVRAAARCGGRRLLCALGRFSSFQCSPWGIPSSCGYLLATYPFSRRSKQRPVQRQQAARSPRCGGGRQSRKGTVPPRRTQFHFKGLHNNLKCISLGIRGREVQHPRPSRC